MLDERKAAILRAVVQEYIETAQPVGSTHIASAPGVQVSSATVRNEMASLEQEGYLAQPHTSAGRVPTDKGYRFFVDHLATPGRLDSVGRAQVGDFFAHTHGALERMLQDTSRLLAHVTNYAAVVVGPKAEAAVVRSVQLVGLSPRVAMLVAVLSNGSVENESIELAAETPECALSTATALLHHHLVGRSVGDVQVLPSSGDDRVDALVTAVVERLCRQVNGGESVFVGGAAAMAQAFDAVDVVRTVLQTLEQQYVVVSLIREVLDRGLTVAIGNEHGIEPLAACSVVVAPVQVDGETLGTVGVLGPTRMNYPQALAAVEIVSDRLGRRLADG
jgi:heat-inducible transcriptional repressor